MNIQKEKGSLQNVRHKVQIGTSHMIYHFNGGVELTIKDHGLKCRFTLKGATILEESEPKVVLE